MPPSKRPRHHFRDSALFKIPTRRRLAEVLHTDVGFLQSLEGLALPYVTKWKHKRDDSRPWLTAPPDLDKIGDYRPISLSPPKVKTLQSRVADLLARLHTPAFVYSPVRGLSYVDNAAAHLGSRAFWLLDIENYFTSCRARRVEWFFATRMQCSPDVAAILVQITTNDDCLPQGSPSSPALSFFCNSAMWEDIHKLVVAEGCKMSVYADDITLSGDVVPKRLVWQIKEALHKHGFNISKDKELSTVDMPADITGVIVRNNQLLLPNRQLKTLNEARARKKSHLGPVARRRIENEIAGRKAQRRQILLHPANRRD